MIKKATIIFTIALCFILGCGGSGGDGHAETAQDIHDNMCLDLGCSAGCAIYTEEDPDGAGTIQYCEDVENE